MGKELQWMGAAEERAKHELPKGSHPSFIRLYAMLVAQRFAREAKPEPDPGKKATLAEIDVKLKDLQKRAEQEIQEEIRRRLEEQAKQQAAAAHSLAFANVERFTTVKGAGGAKAVRTPTRREVSEFIAEIKKRAAAKNVEAPFKTILALVLKKFGLDAQTLNAPGMAHVKAALAAEQKAEKERIEAQRLAAEPAIPEEDVQAAAQEAGTADVLELIAAFRQKFGVDSKNFRLPRFRHATALLVKAIEDSGVAAISPEEDLEMLLL